jgi:predicted RND superfamily exporter protein
MKKYRSVTSLFFDRVLLQHPRLCILGMLTVVVFLAFEARHFRLDASAETLILQNDKDLRYARLIDSRYEQHDFLVLTYTPKDYLFSDKTLASLAHLQEELKPLEHVLSVFSILDAPLFESPPVSFKELTSDLPTLESPKVDRNLARIEFRDSPLYRNLLLSPDLKTTALLIYFSDDAVYQNLLDKRNQLLQKKASGSLTSTEHAELESVNEQFQQHRDKMRQSRHQDIAAIRSIMDKYRGDAELFLGGVSMVANDMISFIKKDLKIFGIGVLVFLILTLGIIFRRKRWILLPMLCCVISVLCMLGILGWFGWEVTVISSNFISLQLIITMSITIHLIVRYREFAAAEPKEANRKLILDTVRTKLTPCLYAVLTTVAGFASLLFCNILPVITFGWMMIAGLFVSLVVTFLFFPAILTLIPQEITPRNRQWRFSITSITANLTETYGVLILGISGLIFILSFIGISKLQVENCFINYFKKNTEIHQGMKVIDQHLGGTTPLDVIIDFKTPDSPNAAISPEQTTAEGSNIFDEFEEYDKAASADKYWFTAEKISRIKAVHNYLHSLPETGKVLSLATIVSIAEKLNGGKALDSLDLALLYSETPDEFKNMLIKPYVSVEHNQARFWLRVRDSEKTLRRNELLKKIKADLTGKLNIDTKQIHLTGLLVLYNNMLQSLFGSQILTLGITVLLLMGMFLALFRSLRVSLIAMIPNVLPIAVVLGVMGWLNIPLDMMTITIAAIGLGISVDDTIHYIHRFKHEFQKDRKYLNTMHRCHETIGHAMYYTSVTIIIGFSILALSNFIPTVYFGLLTSLAMFIAILTALTLLPQLLILVKPFGKEP